MMRLNLRNMLLYLDDCLDEAEAKELGEKIAASKFASSLVHRIRNSVRKLRLAAPKLEGKGLGLDANSVAEYFEGSLSPETIPDFEKVCLESDLQLAEVAACHQILALVLNEPVEIAPPLRDRIYRVGQVSVSPMPTSQTVQKTEHQNQPPELSSIEKAPQPVETTAPPVGEQKKLTEEKVTRAKPEVPDYLKAGQKRFVPLVITALAVFIVLSVVFFAIGPKQIASWFGGDEPSESPDASAKLTPKPGTPEADSTSTDGSPADEVKLGETDSLKDSGPTSPNGKTPVVEPNPAEPTRDGSLTDGVKEPDDDSPKVAPVPLPIPGVDLPKRTPGDVPPKTIDKPEDNPAVKPAVVPDQPDPRPVVAVDMGRFTSENQVIARYDSETGASYRLETNSRLRSKDRLIVPPTYRPQLAFSSGLQATLVGPMQLQLDAIAEEATPHLKVDYGRALLMTIRAGAKVSLNLGGKKGLATFSTADSSMAIDVQHYRAPGTNPETEVSHLIIHLIALRGEIVWQHADGELTIGPNGVVMHFDDQVARTGKLKKLPTWIVAPKLGSGDFSSAEANMQEYGSPIVTRLIDERRPLVVSLEETLNHRNVEVRALAAHGLNQLGNHDSFLTLLADKMNKPYWDYHFDAAQQALARDPQAAADLRISLEKLRGEDGQKLYRLLWGFSPDQLTDDAVATQLIDYLNHESLEFRVLAFINLRRITGTSHLYRPEVPERFRSGHILTWRRKLTEDGIAYKKLPLPPTLLSLTDVEAKPETDDAKNPVPPKGAGRGF